MFIRNLGNSNQGSSSRSHLSSDEVRRDLKSSPNLYQNTNCKIFTYYINIRKIRYNNHYVFTDMLKVPAQCDGFSAWT